MATTARPANELLADAGPTVGIETVARCFGIHRTTAYELAQQHTMLSAARDRLDVTGAAVAADGAARAAAAALQERLVHRDSSTDPAPVRAPWRGLGIELIPKDGWTCVDADQVELRITLAHRRVDRIDLPLALLARSRAACVKSVSVQLARWLERLDLRVDEVAQGIADAQDGATRAKRAIDTHRFERMDELAAAEAFLAEITVALEASVDHQGVA